MSASDILKSLSTEWATPRRPFDSFGRLRPFKLRCQVDFMNPHGDGTTLCEERTEWPTELRDMWRAMRGARLFEDVDSRQWGLELLGSQEALALTADEKMNYPDYYAEGDIVVGRFINELHYLLVRADSQSADFGMVVVTDPIDPREEWLVASHSLVAFLRTYSLCAGLKFWEYAENLLSNVHCAKISPGHAQ